MAYRDNNNNNGYPSHYDSTDAFSPYTNNRRGGGPSSYANDYATDNYAGYNNYNNYNGSGYAGRYTDEPQVPGAPGQTGGLVGRGGNRYDEDDGIVGGGNQSPTNGEPRVGLGHGRTGSAFDADEFVPAAGAGGLREKAGRGTGGFKAWKYETQGNLWTKGTRARCCGRFFCCTVMITVFLVISIVLSLVLWVRPPNVIIDNVTTMAINGSSYSLTGGTLRMNLGVDIVVDNPNYFPATLQNLRLNLTYPIGAYPIGGGTTSDIHISSNTQTNFTFPFSLEYSITNNTGSAVLTDLTNKCTNNQDITVDYDLDIGVRILLISVSPTISNSFSFACPISGDGIGSIISGLSG